MTPMDNFYPPTGGSSGDHQPTEQFWHGQGAPPGGQDPRYGYPWQQPGLPAHTAKDRHQAWHWTVGIALAALLAGGGVIAGVSLASTSLSGAPAAGTGAETGSTGTGAAGTGAAGTGTAGAGGGAGSGAGSSTGSGPGGAASQAVLLNAALNAAGSPDAAFTTTASAATGVAATGGPSVGAGTGTASVAPASPAARRCARAARAAREARLSGHPRLSGAARAATARCRFIRRRIVRFFLLRGVDGQFSFRTRSGAIRTLAYERGVIESVTGGHSIVVKAADGTIWTWNLVSRTVVRDSGGRVSESTLAVGEPVWVGGRVVGGAKDARLIFVRPPSG